MLSVLKIKNVALIDDLTIEFGDKLNIISGETGSGKSIMLDSLGLCFGERGDKTLIRAGQNKMKVSALFTDVSSEVCERVAESFGIECDGQILLDREYDSNGKSVARINGELTTTNALREVSKMLVDLHGQHEHQAIINRDYQLDIIDQYVGKPATDLLTQINSHIDNINNCHDTLKSLGGSPEQQEYFINLYRYQIEEISGANIAEGELEELITKRDKMNAVEKIGLALKTASEQLSSFDGDNACSKVNMSTKELNSISHLDNAYQSLADRLNNAYIELKDIADELGSELENIYYDRNEYERIDERIDLIKRIFKKYGGDLTNVTAYLDDIVNKVAVLENSGETFAQATADIEKYEAEVLALQSKLTALRQQGAKELSAKVVEVIKTLGIPNARLEVQFTKTSTPYTRKGSDEVDFMFSANTGFAPRSLAKIISGGEMSRFMLAYKTVVARLDGIDTLLFDEIDSGISGDIGQKVAQNISALAASKQIIAITHLPTIASFADRHLFVHKESDNTTTHSIVTLLDHEGQVREIARMLGSGGEKVGLELARRMKLSAKNQIDE